MRTEPMLPAWIKALPFRLGTTSYIFPADILPNVHYLAGKVRDVELILFELEDGENNLPDAEMLSEMRTIGEDHDLHYTIHLPLDLDLGAVGEERSKTLRKAQRVIETTRSLDPWAFVVHLDGHSLRQSLDKPGLDPACKLAAVWHDQAVQALELLGGWIGDNRRLAVENLDGYPPDFNFPVLERLSVTQCVDIGHLWKDGMDPIAYLNACLPRTRVIHLHGILERDHRSLAYMPASQIDEVISLLMKAPFKGTVTLEVFSESDLHSSLHTIQSSLERLEIL